MSVHIDDLLKAILAPLADFEEKQLIKEGDLGRCAARVIRKQRRKLAWLQFSFGAFLFIPLILMSLLEAFAPRDSSSVLVPLLFMMPLHVLPKLSDVRASLTRLETVASLWLMADSPTNPEGTTADEKSELAATLTTI